MQDPGLHGFVFYRHYEANNSKDNNGNDNAALSRFQARADSLAFRLEYVYPNVSFLGASVSSRVGIALASPNVQVGINLPFPKPVLDKSGSASGFSDLSLFPVTLGWHSPNFHQQAHVEFVLPTASYNQSNNVNLGRNYRSVAPAYLFTWLPDRGWDVNGKIRYQFNGNNSATNYRSGKEASIEMSANYRLNQQVALGVSGYTYQQTTDDVQNGLSVNGNGNKGRVSAIGPSLTYFFSPKVALVAKIQKEFNARNRAEGTALLLQIKVPF